jgi:hypothetical protein
MCKIALVLTLATVTPLLAQSSSSYRITHTYTLGGDGGWDYWGSIPPITVCSSSPQNLDRHLRARPATEVEEQCCPDHSR